jgi:PKD repeat protein
MKNIYLVVVIFLMINNSYSQSNIIGYQYWFNNDYANKITTSVSATPQILINQKISTAGLIKGINVINFRSFDSVGKYSSVLSHFFYKTSVSESNINTKIVAYEYWIDNDYSNAVTINSPIQQHVNIDKLISMKHIVNGIHFLKIRFKDSNNLWSSVLSYFFYKTPEQIISQNIITDYRYWFDNDFNNAQYISLTPNQHINLNDKLDLKHLKKGSHIINFQFKDTIGKWSAIISDSIEKTSLPIADFSYTAISTCDSTIISFTDKSIDGDKYLWDFGDGNTDSVAHPTHIFYTPNIYQVSLTVSDTTLKKDSTIIVQIPINLLKTFSNISDTACFSYTAPDGQIYNTSGIKTAVIQNAAGCDSTITINLLVKKVNTLVSQFGATLSAMSSGAIYQWLDCNNGYSEIMGETNQSFTATRNGNYAVEINQDGCIDSSACYKVSTLGLIKNTFENEISIFPNPTKGLINVNLGTIFTELNVEIIDMNGKSIFLTSYNHTDRFELNLNIPSGVYLLNIYSGNKKAILRLIKD